MQHVHTCHRSQCDNTSWHAVRAVNSLRHVSVHMSRGSTAITNLLHWLPACPSIADIQQLLKVLKSL